MRVRSQAGAWERDGEYIHNNPLKREYVDDPVSWRYSSAGNYAKRPGLIDVLTEWSSTNREAELR
ncbi:hypothetical protein Pan44_00700 [Caulifigura coniformis]|uniref:Transposase IS200-like domain-containing protein n=1 Tax=Caulifigura coniformis TaxID=2527983 RepID=A0A517S7G7_9PLAN|nr:hypothetical protein Pan44_00700 [Caulifigura coniformis]